VLDASIAELHEVQPAEQMLARAEHDRRNRQVQLVDQPGTQILLDGGGPAEGGFRVIGVGPQIGFIFPVAGMQGYLNLKAYKEFDNANRPDGWNAWVTFNISPAAPPPAPVKPMFTK